MAILRRCRQTPGRQCRTPSRPAPTACAQSTLNVQLLLVGLAPQVLRPVLAEFAGVNFAGVRRPTGYLAGIIRTDPRTAANWTLSA